MTSESRPLEIPDEINVIVQKLSLQLAWGNFDAASAIVDEAEREHNEKKKFEKKHGLNLAKMSVSLLPIEQRVLNGLNHQEIFTLEQLLNLTPEQFLRFENFNFTTFRKVRAALVEFFKDKGIYLGSYDFCPKIDAVLERHGRGAKYEEP